MGKKWRVLNLTLWLVSLSSLLSLLLIFNRELTLIYILLNLSENFAPILPFYLYFYILVVF